MNDKAYFLRKFFRSPRTIGSITPSSRYLTEAMFRTIDWDTAETIVELGAGTGVFTKRIFEERRVHHKTLIYERDDDMRKRLQSLYPQFYYLNDAIHLKEDLRHLGLTQVDYIISGLPFANFHQSDRIAIINGVCDSLKPGGQFIAFQYSCQMYKLLKEQFTTVKLRVVPLNIPPAIVYYCAL